ncbi:NFX1-type zinc finger-containing protein 1 isoform X2 [Gouania willdenowi]|uniref:NFX1-type zinc finger-containing protein 1 isoform X2 n=1 Tax=Gouania willdenowi TaxID=441366 RepID=UPI00105556D8|nr:NFX1-type zinc finger-containing protein 1 isoform X2 [Gouania willdenowi]
MERRSFHDGRKSVPQGEDADEKLGKRIHHWGDRGRAGSVPAGRGRSRERGVWGHEGVNGRGRGGDRERSGVRGNAEAERQGARWKNPEIGVRTLLERPGRAKGPHHGHGLGFITPENLRGGGRGVRSPAGRGRSTDRGGRGFNAVMGRGRGGDRERSGVRGNAEAERQGARRKNPEVGVRTTRESPGTANGPHHGHGLGFKTLENLSEEEPSVVAITLSSHPALKTVLAETAMRKDLIELLCLVLSKALKSRSDRSILQRLAGVVKDSGFFCNILPHCLGGMGVDFDPARRALYPQHLENILDIISEVLNMYPASSLEAVGVLLTLLQATINRLRASGVDLKHELEETVGRLQALIGHLQQRSWEGTLRSDRDTYALLPAAGDNPDEEEQQNFRTIPIYPTPEEFHQDERPFLRPNLTTERYSSTHIYLDTHFRLLREDFVRPLREGIQQLLKVQADIGGADKPLKMKRFDDIRVYFDTELITPKCTNTGLAYIVQFDIKPLQFVRWENSKRLIYGSLLCLSCDNFESFLYATVSDREPKELKEGRVQVTFTEESRAKLATIQGKKKFLMIETTAYFEAYRYVLEGLQEQEDNDLPFEKYIVECSEKVEPPAYLQRDSKYDLSSVAHRDSKLTMKPFDCLIQGAWPAMDKLGLDESQMKAFQLALTNELAIIQGPPGTGKTYVGLKIAQALLMNSNLWSDNPKTRPMLVVCYTNHALDQFLEGILEFLPRGIVRVGGRSNSEKLKPFFLRELAHSYNVKRTLPSQLSTAYNQIYGQLCDVERDIEQHSVRLLCSVKGVLREAVLVKFISQKHWDSLHQRPTLDEFVFWNDRKPSVMREWLGLSSMDFLQRETENVNRNEAAKAEELEEDELIEIAEEADLIQAERIVEDWSFNPHHGRDGKKKRNMEESVEAVEKLMFAVNLNETQTATEESNNEWQISSDMKKKMKRSIKKELRKSSTMSEEEEDNVLNVWTLSWKDKWRLYRLWLTRYQMELRTKALRSEEEYQNTVERLAFVKEQQNLHLLKQATVIGMTTTGAAKSRRMLQELRPRVVIVEEAAEVLEAHIITTLSKDCQHLILIGDHQQLRPSATVYELAKNFSLEMSMFERLVKMGLPFVRLKYQHRMRPEIARLLTPHIYNELQNHPSVLVYEDIKGLKTNLFFVEHNHHEEEIKDGKSHQNQHEAHFIVSLCSYLLLQDYKPEQISILTTYTGQLHCLRKLMPAKNFTGVKVHVVDKYQGEENDIILLSLVRSNAQNKVGFLNVPNRVCVALSRAKKGLYIIGNGQMLSQVKLWSNIFHTLREKDQVGKALTLCCQNHPEKQVQASSANDFKQAPEGGCTQPCEFRLDCGHVCSRVCHPYDPQHKEYKCDKPCQKILCDQGHRCKRLCHSACPEKCSVKVEKIVPRCQHTQMVPCHQDPKTFVCQEPCLMLLQCGHPCASHCGEPCSSCKCQVIVTLTLECGHSQQNACFYKTQREEPACKNPCEHQLKCGHPCSGSCGKCSQGRFHVSCSQSCDRLLICSHKCREPCTRDCPPCERPCENRCVHSKCMKPCGQPCAPCLEPCVWQCRHHRCSKLCCEPCDRPPCNQPCDKQLECGHKCIGLCGDKCPNKCRVCDHEEVTEIFFGTECDPDALFIQLQDCGHIVEYTGMDTYMGLEEEALKLKECPKCRTPLRKNLRYGSYINKCLAEIEMVKEKINGQPGDIETLRKILQIEWKDILRANILHHQAPDWYFTKRLQQTCLTRNDIRILENQIDFHKRIGKLLNDSKLKMLPMDRCSFERYTEQFVLWLNSHHLKFTDQQVFDLERELQKLRCLAALNARCYLAEQRQKTNEIHGDVLKIKNVLTKNGQFTEADQKSVNQAMDELDKKVPPTGLGISEDERKMIVSAIKLPAGHWHKCPNGHVYLITECGGAMERRSCPDCGVSIGGERHTLDSGNTVASEMDGAQHSAWSEVNNLLNFHHLDL